MLSVLFFFEMPKSLSLWSRVSSFHACRLHHLVTSMSPHDPWWEKDDALCLVFLKMPKSCVVTPMLAYFDIDSL